MAQSDATSALVLLEFEHSYGLGFVASGRIVTCLHVVQGEPSVDAHLADGRMLKVRGISAIDAQRNLVVLDVGLLDVSGVRSAGDRLCDEGTVVRVFGMVNGEEQARWTDGRIGAVQVLGGALSLYRLEGALPPDASGGPLVDGDGAVLGVVMATQVDEGVELVGLPWRYVAPLLLQNRELALSLLNRRVPRREVPEHSIAVLEGSSVDGLEEASRAISRAIRLGAPAYNEGNIGRCLQVYLDAAREVIDARRDCPGVQAVLRAGLVRADAMADLDLQAWAMRDAFDGLLAVIERYLVAHGGGSGTSDGGRAGYLN
jgi:serine protease Do